MVVQLDSLNQSCFEPFGPWLRRELRVDGQEVEVDISATILHGSTTLSALKDQVPSRKAPRSDYRPLQGQQIQTSTPVSMSSLTSQPAAAASDPSPPQTPTSSIFSNLASSVSSITFTQIITPPPNAFSFNKPSSSRDDSSSGGSPTLKRPRSTTDVDGPNTSSLGHKKRRLRRHLITSRLSQPFSLPATHILNREAVAAGDKRFLKLAAIMNARRLAGAGHHHPATPGGQPGPSEMLRRAAIINRFRLRVCAEAEMRGDERVARVAGSPGLLHMSQGLGIVGARFPVPAGQPVGVGSGSGHSVGGIAPSQTSVVGTPALRLPSPVLPLQGQPHPLSRAAAVARSSPPGSPRNRPADASGGSGQLAPLRAVPARERELEADEVVGDDEECSFHTSELEGRYDDELDDVYADFSVIFGGGGAGSDDEDEEIEGVEDCMDDLDGIPWIAR